MDKPQNRFLSVTYQLYTVTNGEKTLEEQTGEDRPFEFITGYGIALDAFEQNLSKQEKGTPKCVKITDYRGNDDCSGRLRCAWDDQYLYVQAEVTDDIHVQKVAGEKLWGGDCVQLALRPGNANLTYGYDGREREIGLALTEHGFAFAYQWMGGPQQGILDNTPVSVKREGSQTHYCAAIPWSTLLMSAPTPGDTFSFSFTFNDNDDNGLRGWLEWTPGVCGGKDSSLFGELHFVE